MSASTWRPDDDLSSRARIIALEIVSSSKAQGDLAAYYAVDGDYAGATFAGLGDNDPFRITPTDLLAVTSLSVSIPPLSVRRFTSAVLAPKVSRLLGALPTDVDIRSGEALAPAMSQFYDFVKSCLRRSTSDSSNGWVTASKICARKRPLLFPVRDSVVVDVLGLKGSYPDDWPVFAALMDDRELTDRVHALVGEVAENNGVDIGDPSLTLKHLDVLIWMHGIRQRKATTDASTPPPPD
ncbi:DUF6308 family protein [Janibacter indicus]|uniref:Uncharacterized protein n=1 Tax=Janibacter indicus TaxID=857417 RepID=A0A1W2A8K5_9MICO|nr:DUF6308 family protein [Janibacter indicus]SMC56970.1 hypothetical protein SAMN06296429_105151 [Janibacter indicus]